MNVKGKQRIMQKRKEIDNEAKRRKIIIMKKKLKSKIMQKKKGNKN